MFTVPFGCVDPLSCHISDPVVIFSCGSDVVPGGCGGLSCDLMYYQVAVVVYHSVIVM